MKFFHFDFVSEKTAKIFKAAKLIFPRDFRRCASDAFVSVCVCVYANEDRMCASSHCYRWSFCLCDLPIRWGMCLCDHDRPTFDLI